MDWAEIAKTQGLTALFAIVTLKMLYDLVYKKIPRGFRELRKSIRLQRIELTKKMDENTEAIDLLREEVINLEDLQMDQAKDKEPDKPRLARKRRKKPGAIVPRPSGGA